MWSFPQTIIRVIKSRSMRWVGHVAREVEKRILARETLRRETVLKYEAWIGG
jgi:hypothetical protein